MEHVFEGVDMPNSPKPVLSTRQTEVLEYIRSTAESRGYPPSVREIAEALGLRSPSTVHSHISSLVKYGYLRRDPSKPRAIEVVGRSEEPISSRPSQPGREVPLVGRIAAGTPILAEEDIQDTYTLPTEIVGTGPVFMLEVRGDSMVDVGILNGDFVVIRRQPDALDGQIVAALVDGEEATIKRLERRDGQVILHAENEAYEPMTFSDGVEIIGKVVSVLRTL
jgi:repressor LexA